MFTLRLAARMLVMPLDQAGILIGERIVQLGNRAGPLGVQGGRTAVHPLAPFGELGGVDAMLAQQGTPAGVAALVGIIFGQDGAALVSRQDRAVGGWHGLVHRGVLVPCSKRISRAKTVSPDISTQGPIPPLMGGGVCSFGRLGAGNEAPIIYERSIGAAALSNREFDIEMGHGLKIAGAAQRASINGRKATGMRQVQDGVFRISMIRDSDHCEEQNASDMRLLGRIVSAPGTRLSGRRLRCSPHADSA